ncbi:MAG: CDP-glucose 4,6-dehydratase [Bacteroidia bacterium]|nr:CDP-glucose 4,6-dehydratase [Bacteroidia bacterium]
METAFKRYYAGKRVLVTGDTGFKGSWLCIWLNELGADVTGFALAPPSEPNNFSICRLDAKIRHVHGDVRDLAALTRLIEEVQPEIVFHLAAQALVRYSYEVPRETLETNILGTVNVLEAVRQSPSVHTVVVVTSDKCYENREQVWGYKENDPMGGDDPYSASKGAVEIVCRSYLKSFFSHREMLGGVSVRAGNVIGGGDWGRDRIVPDCINALKEGRVIEVRNPMAIRPWQHVLEPLSGYLWLGARLHEDVQRFSGGWNFGPADSSAKCVGDLAGAIVREWKTGAWLDISDKNDHRLHEAGWLRLSCDKAHFMLPWNAVLSFDETIAMTVKWYKYFYEYADTNMYQYCVHQIRDYTRLAAQKEQMWAA